MYWFDTATETDLLWCDTCQGFAEIVGFHETPGFCSGWVQTTDLSCGCSETDAQTDLLED